MLVTLLAEVARNYVEVRGLQARIAIARQNLEAQQKTLELTQARLQAGRAAELEMDPGVLCPNSALEAMAWRAPRATADLEELDELKGWFVHAFGAEAVEVCRRASETPEPEAARES